MRRSSERVLTTFVGSLIRPPELRQLQTIDGADPRQYADTLRAAVGEAVRHQVDIGLDVVSDGEFGKSNWAGYILNRVSGFELRPVPPDAQVYNRFGREGEQFADFYSENVVGEWTPRRVVCAGPITYRPAEIQRDIANFKAALTTVDTDVEAFMPVVAPASFLRDAVNEFYATEEEYLYAIADALRQEYQAILDAGFLLQVDDAVLATMWLVMESEGLEAYRRWAELRIEALNNALRGLPQERVRYHLCWGSWPGPHVTDIPLEHVVDLLLRVNAGAYAIEAGNPRHMHEWRVWQSISLPPGTVLIPGVISHCTPVVEHPQLVSERIVRYANLVGKHNVIAGSDCGFAQSQGLARVPSSIMWAKLAVLVEGARLATKELF
ncbi:MAG: cobalamin-independent methionine synthase II family protein [Chloroflexi bacterium]|nr:cobalamin-independent methionine synthase II family protein [Chloroflexota bacterium]MBV9897991.1 cobalamin-independent methionine synthase II family protein [Chloroflexota bacterium]